MFVKDHCFQTSIKDRKQDRKANTGQTRITASRPAQAALKQLKKYLSDGQNKTELFEFLLHDWCNISISDNRILCLLIPQLSSKQEETDTKMFLAASYASCRGCNSVAIETVDSDVANLGKLQVLEITQALFERSLSQVLLGLQTFSGCDSASAFHSIGKVKWLNLVMSKEIF